MKLGIEEPKEMLKTILKYDNEYYHLNINLYRLLFTTLPRFSIFHTKMAMKTKSRRQER
jgi:hypothetical protein